MTNYRSSTSSPEENFRSRSHSQLQEDKQSRLSSYAKFLTTELIGWYKIDEGEGDILYNSASPQYNSKLSDLTITTDLVAFWTTLLGFGTAGRASWVSDTPINIIEPLQMGLFSRITDWPMVYSQRHAFGVSAYTTGWTSTGLLGGYYYPDNLVDFGYFQAGGGSGGASTGYISKSDVFNRWNFHFIGYDPAINERRYYVVKDDGTLHIGAPGAHTLNQYVGIKRILLFSGSTPWNGSDFVGQIGDVIVYTDQFDSDYLITLADWGNWYDTLRDRYGMDEKSGW